MAPLEAFADDEEGESANPGILKELVRTSSWLRRYDSEREKGLSDVEVAQVVPQNEARASSVEVKSYYAALLGRAEKHSVGLCSTILRVRIAEEPGRDDLLGQDVQAVSQRTGAVAGWVAIKVVSLEDQPPPHDVFNEYRILSLAAMLQHQSWSQRSESHKMSHPPNHVVSLLSAFVRAPGPWSKEVSLVLPLYPCTLAEALRVPTDHIPSRGDRPEQTSQEPELGPQSLTVSPSSPQFAHKVTKGVVTGLQFLHSMGIAHRDVKPANILLSYDGAAVLADLGVSTRVPASHATTITPSFDGPSRTTEVGTTSYRPPELLFSPSKGYDGAKADIWSAGASLVELWTALEKKPVRRKKRDTANLPHWEAALADETTWQQYTGRGEAQANPSGQWLVDEEDEEEEGYGAQEAQEESELIRDWKRKPLFDGRGEIALAGSIFALLGRPTDQSEWPVSPVTDCSRIDSSDDFGVCTCTCTCTRLTRTALTHPLAHALTPTVLLPPQESAFFSPPLDRMPFPVRKAAQGGLRKHLDLAFRSAAEEAAFAFCEAALSLSAGARPSASEALARLEAE